MRAEAPAPAGAASEAARLTAGWRVHSLNSVVTDWARRGERLTLTEREGGWSAQAAPGALALFKKGDDKTGDADTATVTDYERPPIGRSDGSLERP